MVMNSNSPFALRKQELQQTQKPISPFSQRKQELQQEEKKSDSLWGQFMDEIFSEKPSAFEEGLGQSARAIGPAIAGLPGNITQLVKSASEHLPKQQKLFQRKPNKL